MKKPRAPKLVTVAITTTITVIFWVFFTLYQVLTTKPSPSVEPQLLEPIDPTLDTNSLDSIKDRVFFENGSFVPVNKTESPAESDTETEASPTPEKTASPEASTT